MDVLKLKMEILERVMQTNDESILAQLKRILSPNTGNSDFADELSDQQISDIKKGLKEAEQGKVKDWNVAMDRLNGQ